MATTHQPGTGQDPPQPDYRGQATVVDTDPPQQTFSPPSRSSSEEDFNAWGKSSREEGWGGWPGRKAPVRRVRRQSVEAASTAPSVLAPRPVGRLIAAWALWTFAAGLLVGPLVAGTFDAGLQAGFGWLAPRAPFLRPYLPLPPEPPAPLRHHLNLRHAVATAPTAVPERPVIEPRHRAHAKHGKGASAAAADDPSAPTASKHVGHARGEPSDPVDNSAH